MEKEYQKIAVLQANPYLDFGLYFFGLEQKKSRYVVGRKNKYFNPKKPTVIYVHGWERGTTVRNFRETFEYKENNKVKFTHTEWLKKGWNVAIFYWNQFSDEPEVKYAEAKIWTYRSPQKMRWKDSKGKFNRDGKLNFSLNASELLYYFYSHAFKGAQPVRLVGHSLGSQMVVALCEHILNQDKSLLPRRIALLDPFWSKGDKAYLPVGHTAARVFNILKKLSQVRRTPIELYRSSLIGESRYLVGLQNLRLRKLTAYAVINPAWEGFFNFHGHHISIFPYYFNSYSAKSCPKCVKAIPISAAASGAQILSFMGSPHPLVQVKGQKSFSFKDDLFVRGKD